MEQSLSKIRSMREVAQEAINYIEGRKERNIVSLKTRWEKFNKQCMGGIEPNTVYTIAGISGTGKSSFVNTMTTDLIDLNPSEDIVILNFSLEMVGFRQVGRTLSKKLRKTTSTLYSSETSLDDETFKMVVNVSNQLKEYPIYFIDNPDTPMQVEQTIKDFYKTYVKDKKKHFIITYDHTLLTKQVGSVLETTAELERVFIQAKKLPMTSVIQIAQMNRNIESSERINNPLSHYPMRSDLSSSDAMFQASDYVLVMHRPEILNIQEYGPNRLPTQNKIYMHMLKNRDAGKPKTFSFTSKKNNNNSKFFLNTGYTNYSKAIDDIILADITKKNSYLFGDNNYSYTIDDEPIILSGKLNNNDEFIKAANFLANYKTYKKKYITLPYELNKMYTLSDGTRIVFYDDEIQIGSLFYKYSDLNNLAFLNTIDEPTKKIIINININLH